MIKTKELNTNRGITLIALIITIIVMLILVAVTINMAVNGGLFVQAGKAVAKTNETLKSDQELSSGKIQVGADGYDSLDDFLAGKTEMKSYEDTTKENGFLTASATYTSGKYTAVIPKGFAVSSEKTEQSIEKGLVIKDANGNEFVWIPVEEDIANVYPSESNLWEPCELRNGYENWSYEDNGMEQYEYIKYDSQDMLDRLYGAAYYNYETDFKYVEEYAQMVKAVNENNGFYIGRYETTINETGKVGSEENKTVLTADATLFTENSTNYPYRWYGLYYAQKHANVTGNGTDVQTAMIYGTLWNETMKFISAQKTAGNTTYDIDTPTESWHTSSEVAKSGQANAGDVALNIWDLESNVIEWSQMSYSGESYRIPCGGVSVVEYLSASATWGFSEYGSSHPTETDPFFGTRLVMLLK